MARSALLILAVLVGSCAQFTDAVNADVQNNEPSEKTESYMPKLCSPTPGTSSSPSSVHALRPVDIAGVYALGIPPSHRREASSVVNRVAELLSMFNPEVITPHVDQTSSQPRTLLEEAEELSLSLSRQATDWKLVLLFVPADFMCASSPDIAADVNTVLEEVEAALELLQERLQNTLVHVAVWSKTHSQDKCECTRDDGINQRLHKAILLKTLQDTLSHVVENPKWHSERPDFTAVLQSVPVILEEIFDSENTWFDPNQLAVQLWTNLLQLSTGGAEVMKSSVINIPCPTQERPFLRTQNNSPTERQVSASTQADTNMGTDIHCTERSPSPAPPTSVHEVRPADIKVVAAVGDSLTAANGVGAKYDSLLLVMNEYRGLSWSIGGDENITTVTTLPNILREFNPSLTGFSVGISDENAPKSFLNQAVPGAKCGDMEQQVRVLVNLMKNDSRIDFHNDWKVITMFIGGNDLCDFCTDSIFYSPRNVVLRIQNALDILHKEVPRAIVNLVELFDIVPLRGLHNDQSLGCPTWFVNIVCPCVLKPKEGSIELQKLKDFNMAYQRNMRDLIDSGVYNTSDDFTVVLQPFPREIYLPMTEDGRPDRSYFSPDCFHLSQKAHTLMAIALWNNMLEPVGNKTSSQDFEAGIDLKCPSQTSPFIRTAVNSNYIFPGPTTDPAPPPNWGSDFSCVDIAPSNSVPTSAHRVRPADIQVVAGVGDSLTAAFGARAKHLLQLPIEYRGVSWSIGGDETLENVTTLPNILKKFNPELKGMSFGQGKNKTGFNVAVSGAKVAGIPGQIRRLIDLMKNDSTVDFENDWKLVTIFIGGNDLCQYCNDRAALSPENYAYHMMTSLDMLHKEVPRTIVSILEILEIEGLRRIKGHSLGCTVIQPFVCPCFLTVGENSPELAEVKRVNRQMQVETEKLAYGGRYDDKEDFAVVVQPFFRNTIVPLDADGNPDITYFSEDCFHFSERGHADMATAMWNNMLEPVGKKQIYNNFTNSRNNINCPTEEHPYIFTKVNSFPASPATTPPKPEITTTLPTTTPTITETTATLPSATPTITETTTTPPKTTDNVPIWVPIVVAIVGLLVGSFATWLLLSCIAKRSKKQKMSKMRTSAF